MGEVTPYPGALDALQPLVPLTIKHHTSRFDCGRPPLNDWLKFRSLTSEGSSARCFVLCAPNPLVIGYYCLTAGAVQHDGAPRKIGQNMPSPIPVVTIGRMAIDKAYQGKGLGRALLKDALLRIVRASELVGARAVLVHAVDQGAAPFYARYGFKSFPTNNQTLFLPMDEIVAAL
jgi:GNAT superfamily N-acetyltransferase